MNSFPYFAVKCFLTSVSSGMSEHLGDAKTTLAIASFKSIGQFLQINSETQWIGKSFLHTLLEFNYLHSSEKNGPHEAKTTFNITVKG